MLTLKRRLVGTLVGFFVIFVAHLLFALVATPEIGESRAITPDRFMRLVPANTLSDSLPFVLWVVIAREFLWESVGRIFKPPEPGVEASEAD